MTAPNIDQLRTIEEYLNLIDDNFVRQLASRFSWDHNRKHGTLFDYYLVDKTGAADLIFLMAEHHIN